MRETNADLQRVGNDPKGPGSERGFGIVFTVVFCVIGAVTVYSGHWSGPAWFILAGAMSLVAFTRPDWLRPLNRVWFRFGMLLHAVVSPVIMGLIFYAVVTPTGLLMRLFGKRPLSLAFDAKANSYWVRREPPGPKSEELVNQF